MDTNAYTQFLEACIAELQAKEEAIVELHLFERRMDLSRNAIEFVDGNETFAEAEVVFIGNRAQQAGTWLWGWANASTPPEFRERSIALKQLGATTGRKEYVDANAFPATQEDVTGLIAVACHHLGGLGTQVTTEGTSDFYFIVQKVTHFRPPERLLEKAVQGATEAVFAAQGAGLLNMLRRRFPEIRLDLVGADLRGPSLPWDHDLHMQLLFDLDYVSPRGPHDLSGANLSDSRFDSAIMRGLTLRGASFERVSLVDADLSSADLRGVSFREAFLNGVNFNRAQLAGADFTGAELARTLLTGVDLSEVKGLDAVHHMVPSEISLSTLVASNFKLTPTFLRKAGVSRGLLEDLARGKRFSKTYQTCFLSYSSHDGEFATQLYDSLTAAGVRVFWDHFDVIPGEFLNDQIVEAVREHDRLLVVLSAKSMESSWVSREIELGWQHKPDSLVPVRLCPIEDVRRWTEQHAELPKLTELFPVLDFSGWKNREEYEHALSLLLKSFAGGVLFSAQDVVP